MIQNFNAGRAQAFIHVVRNDAVCLDVERISPAIALHEQFNTYNRVKTLSMRCEWHVTAAEKPAAARDP